jgi:hypothetical protein
MLGLQVGHIFREGRSAHALHVRTAATAVGGGCLYLAHCQSLAVAAGCVSVLLYVYMCHIGSAKSVGFETTHECCVLPEDAQAWLAYRSHHLLLLSAPAAIHLVLQLIAA